MANSKNDQKVNQYAIAEHLGVSRSTVSKVFSNRKDVSDEMRLRVINAAKEMGYQYGSLLQAKLDADVPRIGMMVRLGPEAPQNYRSDYLESLSSYAIQAQIALFAHFIPSSVNAELFFQNETLQPVSLRDGQLDALLLAGPWSEKAIFLASQVLPCCALAFGSQHSGVDTTEPDTIGGMRQIVEHLHQRKHRRLAYVGFAHDSYWSTERYAGFLAACASVGIEVPKKFVLEVGSRLLWDPEESEAWSPIVQKATDLIRNRGVTGFVCCSDWTAFHIYAGLNDKGISVPKDVSLTGFDNAEILTWGCPKITSIHVPRAMLAQEAIGRVIRRIKHPEIPAKRSLYECELVDNGTTSTPAR